MKESVVLLENWTLYSTSVDVAIAVKKSRGRVEDCVEKIRLKKA